MKRFLIVPSLVLAVLLALCILNAAALNRRTNRWMDQADPDRPAGGPAALGPGPGGHGRPVRRLGVGPRTSSTWSSTTRPWTRPR